MQQKAGQVKEKRSWMPFAWLCEKTTVKLHNQIAGNLQGYRAFLYLTEIDSMSWIPIIPPTSADSELATANNVVSGSRGRVANILGVHSVRPEIMLAHLRLYHELMFASSELTRAERETVAVVVSRANDCFY